MLEMKIKTGRRSVAPGDLPAILGARRAFQELGDMVETLIAQLDALAGDCDLEAAGDEEDGVGAEDEGCAWFRYYGDGPGDPISDPGEQEYRHLPPVYGIDQRRGILNKGEIEAEFQRREEARSQREYELLLSRRRSGAQA